MNEYDIFGSIYDPLLGLPLRKMRIETLRLLQKHNAQTTIDICCGTGDQLLYLKRNNINGVGIDLNQTMLKQAKKKGVNCYLRDAVDTKFDDNSFDAAIISLALHEKPRKIAEAIIAEASRILKPDGVFVIADYDFTKASTSAKVIIWSIEWLMGKLHYGSFKKYLKYGGLPVLFNNYDLLESRTHELGTTAVNVYRNSKK